MDYFKNLEFKKHYLIDTFVGIDGNIQNLYLVKTLNYATNQESYYLKIYSKLQNGVEYLKGYLYFFVIHKENKSKYVGTFIEPNSRNSGLSSLLTATWIKLCLDNKLEILITNRKQEKPFLLYLLKKYYFEIENPDLYSKHENTIYICKNTIDNKKLLYFNNEIVKNTFLRSKSYLKDNYVVIDSLAPNISVLDKVMLNKVYCLTDNENGYRKALKVYKNFKNN